MTTFIDRFTATLSSSESESLDALRDYAASPSDPTSAAQTRRARVIRI